MEKMVATVTAPYTHMYICYSARSLCTNVQLLWWPLSTHTCAPSVA